MKRFKNILFVANFELESTEAFERAVSLAKHNQAQLIVVSTLEGLPAGFNPSIKSISPEVIEKSLTDGLLQQLENLTAHARKTVQIKIKVLTGRPFLNLIQEVLRNKVDLVVKPEGFVTPITL